MGHIINTHLCFFDGENKTAESIIDSLRLFENVGEIILLVEINTDVSNIINLGGYIFQNRFKIEYINKWDYKSIEKRLNSLIENYSLDTNLFINIIGATPVQSFSTCHSTLGKKDIVIYSTDVDNNRVLIDNYDLPHIDKFNHAAKMIIHDIEGNGLTISSMNIYDSSGHRLGTKGLNNALRQLLKEDLIYSTKLNENDTHSMTNRKRGPKPLVYRRTQKGDDFYARYGEDIRAEMRDIDKHI